MKILHTADWHLGQKFLYKDRIEEHQRALDWLHDCIVTQQIDILLVAGDIFDIQNPPNYARSMYYNFLVNLRNTPCRHIVIIGGNHDSPSMLHAPKDLLRAINVYVVGAASEQAEEDVLVLKNDTGATEAIIAAVPFLRDQDIRRNVASETDLERIERIKTGIFRHYQTMGALVETYKDTSIPVIATGHLYAKGAVASGDQSNIYIGNRENISAEAFPHVFDYVALGHIHRAQALDAAERAWYAGSLLPLRFKETKDDKSVSVVHFEGKKIKDIQLVPVPEFRRLKTIEGDLEKVKSSLQRFATHKERDLRPWVEIILHSEHLIPDADRLLRDFAKEMPLDILKISVRHPHRSLSAQNTPQSLQDLTPNDVFEQRIGDIPSEKEQKELRETFAELLNYMQEQDLV